MKPRNTWLLSVLLFAACRPDCSHLRPGQQFTMRGQAPTPTDRPVYTVLSITPEAVAYAVRGDTWPEGRHETGRVGCAVFLRSTKRKD